MAITLQFSGVNCDKIADLSFALAAGGIEVLRVAGKEEKSAVIDLAVGERNPDSGTVALQGAALDVLPRGSIGWVPENGGLISNLKTWENVTLPLWYHGKRRAAQAEEKIAQWLAVLGLEGEAMGRFMASPAGSLTALERKRAGLVRGLVLAPRVLVVDGALFDDLGQDTKASWASALDAFVRGTEGSSVLVVADNGAAFPWKNIG